MMKYRFLGASGVQVSEISLGSWLTYGSNVSENRAFECMKTAVEGGINFFDTADVYNAGEAEASIGRFLKAENVSRTHIQIGTKAYFPMSNHPADKGLSRRHLVNSVKASLQRLQTDYIDLYQCHRYDYSVPLEETCHTMQVLIHQGHILYWGVSQWTGVQIVNALRICERYGWQKPISNQPIYNMINRSLEVEVMEVCENEGIGLVVYSPLMQGILTGKYAEGKIPDDSRAAVEGAKPWFAHKRLNSENLSKVAELNLLAQELGASVAQLALAWCLRRKPVTSVIIGASKPEQINENIGAVEIEITPQINERIEAILRNHPRDQYTDGLVGYGVPKGI